MVRSPTLEDVRRAVLSGGPEPAREELPEGASAVLLPVQVESTGALSLVYTRRAQTLRRHAGEMAFPGGRVDPSDAHPLAAALREAEEEIGLSPRDVDVVGHLTDMTTHYGVLVSAYVGVLRGAAPREPPSKEEVDEILTVPLADLLDPARYESRAHVEMPERRVHYWRLPRGVMWGITGELTARFLRRVCAWEPPGRPRIIDDVSAFRPTST